MKNRETTRQLWAGLLAAGAVPVFRRCAVLGWQWVALGALAAGGLLWLMARLRRPERRPGPGAWAVVPVLLVLAVRAAWAGAEAFPETARSPLAAAFVLGLGLRLARGGLRTLLRTACVLLPLLGVLFGVVLGCGLLHLHPAWLRPVHAPREGLLALTWLLLPGLGLYFAPALRPQAPSNALWMGLLGVCALLASLTARGNLSPALARGPEAFYILAESASVLGVMQRFEALVSAGLLLAAVILTGLLLLVADRLLAARTPGLRQGTRLALLAGCLVLALLPARLVPETWLPLLGAWAWGVGPVLSQIGGKRKNFKINEKKA